ncbi:MAG: hypothetical protein LBB86_00755, partial [Oscillospiraceae bacterium]|nr:hypothetical protein [Oscillospiraceae bacterium]
MKRTLTLLVAAAMLLTLTAPAIAESTPRTTLNTAIVETYTTTDPFHISRSVDSTLASNLYETLY